MYALRNEKASFYETANRACIILYHRSGRLCLTIQKRYCVFLGGRGGVEQLESRWFIYENVFVFLIWRNTFNDVRCEKKKLRCTRVIFDAWCLEVVCGFRLTSKYGFSRQNYISFPAGITQRKCKTNKRYYFFLARDMIWFSINHVRTVYHLKRKYDDDCHSYKERDTQYCVHNQQL